MNQAKTKKNLINWELVSVNPNDKNWDWKDLFCFWGINIQSIIGFSLIASLYLIYDLNSFVVFFGTVFGSLLVYFFFFSVFVFLLLSTSPLPSGMKIYKKSTTTKYTPT